MVFLPSQLYAPSSTIALFNAATQKEQQSLSVGSSEGGFKAMMPVTAYAPVETKKIELYSRVG